MNTIKNKHWHLLRLGFGFLLIGDPLKVSALALDPARSLSQDVCQTWTPQSGLPANGINAITQTKGGFIWLGSQRGLVRYDGVEFKSMELPQNRLFQQQGISSLSASTNGDLWFGILNGAFGLCRRDSGFVALTNQTWVTPNMKVSAIMAARDGALWVGSSASTMRWTTKSNTIHAFDFGGAECKAMFEDSKGRIWLSMLGRGLFYFDGARMNPFPDPAITNQDTIVLGIAEDHDGQFWFATQYGLLVYDADFHPKESPAVHARILCVLADREGSVWIGSDGAGLFCWRHGELTNFRKGDGLADDHLTALFEDREGNLWVGTRGGLNMFSDVKFPLYSPGGTEQNAAFHSVCPAAGGGVWAGSDLGLFRFDGSRFTYYGTNAGLPVLWSKHVLEAANGDVYLADGTQNVEIFRDGKLVARHKCPTWPTGFAEDKLGVVTGSGDHLFRADPGGLTPYAFTNAAPDFGWIRSLNSARDGTILVAGVNGVFRVKDGDYKRFSIADGLPANEALWVCEDSSNVLWAGLAGGVARIEGNHVDGWTHDNGLFDNYVRAIIPDDNGWLWFHSDNGIFRARRDSFMAGGHAAGRLDCEAFDNMDDVKTLETADVEFSACKTHDGRIWIPSPQGIILIDPAHLPPTAALPAVHIEKIRINGKEWSRADGSTVPPGRGELEVQYTAPTFIAPQQQQFRYRLEGYETKWEFAGTRRSAFFANLKPGKYKFLVQACDADGLAGGASGSFEMELLPFFYQTIWVYFVCAGLGLSVLSGIYTWRVSFLHRKQLQLQATQERLEEEVQHRTAELTHANAALREENVERQRAEASLVSSREEFKDLFDNAPVGFHEVDTEGRLVRVNDTELKMQGYTAGELLGQFVWKFFADEEATRQNVLAILREGRSAPQNIARMFRRKDGSTFPVMLNSRLLRREDGAVAGIRSAVQDITEQKRAEQALRESQSLYYSFVEQLPGAAFRKDREGRYVMVNSQFCRIKGLKPGDFLGKKAGEIPDSDEAMLSKRQLQSKYAAIGEDVHEQIMRTGKTVETEEEYTVADGRKAFMRVVRMPVFGADGTVIGTQGIQFDITALKQAEAELKHERSLWRSLLDNSPDQVYFKDAQSRFIKVGAAQTRHFGLNDPHELLGRTDFDFFTEEHARPAFEDEQEIIRTGAPLIGKVEKEVLKDGRIFWVLTSKMPLRDKDGKVIGTFGITKDITGIKETESKLEQAHKELLETSRLAGMAEIATNVLHNIGNVLNSVNVSASLVIDKVKKGKAASLAKVAALMREHERDLGTFITSDAKGRQLPAYLGQLVEQLLADQKAAIIELELLVKNIEHINEVVAMQQSYARVSGVREIINVRDLVEDGLRMNAGAGPPPCDNVSCEVTLITPVALEKGLRFAIREGGHTVGAGAVTEIIE